MLYCREAVDKIVISWRLQNLCSIMDHFLMPIDKNQEISSEEMTDVDAKIGNTIRMPAVMEFSGAIIQNTILRI